MIMPNTESEIGEDAQNELARQVGAESFSSMITTLWKIFEKETYSMSSSSRWPLVAAGIDYSNSLQVDRDFYYCLKY